MHDLVTTNSDSPHDSPDRTAADRDDSLQAVVQDIESFLLAQLERLEDRLAAGQPEAVGQAEDLTAAIARFREEQELWEADRQAESERLRQEGALLQEAWQNLEEERRQLLAEREIVRRGVRVPTVSHEEALAGRDVLTSSASIPESAGGDDRSAWLQFQRMRREIQAHMQPGT